MIVSPAASPSKSLAVVLLLVAAQPSRAARDETPEAFIHRIYALYKSDATPGVDRDRPAGTAFFAPPLLDAFAKDAEVLHGEEGVVDSDPLCDCQAWENLRVKGIALTKVDAGTLKARVTIKNFGPLYDVILTLSRTPAGWRVADVGTKYRPSLMAALLDEIAHPDAPNVPAPPPTSKR